MIRLEIAFPPALLVHNSSESLDRAVQELDALAVMGVAKPECESSIPPRAGVHVIRM